MTRFYLDVGCHAGYRGEETPRYLQFSSRRLEVTAVLDRWLSPDHRYFKLRCDDEGVYIVRHDTATQRWQLTFYEGANRPPGLIFP